MFFRPISLNVRLIICCSVLWATNAQSVFGQEVVSNLAASDGKSTQPFIVEQGQPKAEIVIAPDPPRSTHLAARELQVYIEKISGARLAIVNAPSGKGLVKLFVGESVHTKQLKINSDGLQNGAYRLMSGSDWMVFVGDDTDFVPIEPWPRNNNDIASGKMQAEWDKITGKQWGYMHRQLHKHYSGPNSLFGTPREQLTDKSGNVHVWTYDERGSFNAVCGFLRDQGVRWYMPGEIGEVVPKAKSIQLPKIDRVTQPDFPMRILNFRTAVYGHDVMMWGFRLGVRQPYGRQAAHGLHGMTDNERTLKNHPDWFALYGGKRHNHPNNKNNQLCYSNEELFREAVLFARTQLDHFKMDVVSIMPPDGYTAICQCDLCAGKDSPELGARGQLSNYVWDFVNRVAKEVAKTHPDKKISNCAYGVYTEPPSNIEKLEPNVQVIIVGGRRPTAEDRADIRRLRAAWQKKTDNPVEIFENYPFTGRGWYLPAYMPRVLGESINATKGQSRGEDIWLTMNFKENALGFNHFLVYFTARMYWGGPKQSAAALFDEYVKSFYGPAAPGMAKFFSHCETHWRAMEKDAEKAAHALALFAAAQQQAPSGSVYAQRIQLIDNFLNGLRSKATQLAQKRGPVPVLRFVSGSDRRGKIVIDGKLDDELWQNIPGSSTGRLSELETGRLPTYGTSIKTEWIGNNIYFAIRCNEHPGEKLNIATTKNGDQAIWYGDCIEIHLATDAHSYYQLTMNPAGALVDVDRGAPRSQWFSWSSKAQIATHIADDHWTVEARIPITQDRNDPLHQVIGHKPTRSLPWFVNVCRQRVRDNASEYSAFSPTGKSGFHVPMKFAHLFAGNSQRFEADQTVIDYILHNRQAEILARGRKWNEALAAYIELAETDKVTDFQKSMALQQAARYAANIKDFKQADELAERIPITAVAKTTRMQTLASQRQFAKIVEQFDDEDLTQWPFWQIGEAAYARAKGFYFTKQAKQAESDLQLALTYESDPRVQLSIRTTMAHNREAYLNDPAGALKLYRQNYEGKQRIGGADEFRSVQQAARILARQKEFDAALKTLTRIEVDKLKGIWRQTTLAIRGDILASGNRIEEAKTTYRQALADPKLPASLRKAIEKSLADLNPTK
jgi:hypothetical protein